MPVVRLTHADTGLVKYRTAHLRIEGSDFGVVVCGLMEWPVMFVTTPLHFGGYRRWLCCPECDSRRQALYVDGKRLACRVCLGLRYESQHEDRRQLASRAGNRIREKLGWKRGVLNPIGPKPRGMHWRTFWALKDELDVRTDAVLGSLQEWAERAMKEID